MKKIYLTALIVVTLFACEPNKSAWKVESHGVLREIMQEQKLDSNIKLSDLNNSEHLYGLGALEALSGELVILEGELYRATLNDSSELVIDQQKNGGATLLITSEIQDWEEFPIEKRIENQEDVQRLVEEYAEQNSMDISKPFPFLLEGSFSSFQWHVINAPAALAMTHEAFKNSGILGNSFQEKSRMLGFYSQNHEGVFTHHGSFIHMHVLTENHLVVGHIDDLTSYNKIVLKLPKSKEL